MIESERSALHHLELTFGLGLLLGLAWEFFQFPLLAHAGGEWSSWSHVILGSVGDGVLVLLIYLLGLLISGNDTWYRNASPRWWLLVAATGAVLGIVIELIGVSAVHRWQYMPAMPRIPGTSLGIVPVIGAALIPTAALLLMSFVQRRSD